MTNLMILFKRRKDQVLSFCIPVAGSIVECLERLQHDEKDLEFYELISKNLLPEDRYFRDSLRYDRIMKRFYHDLDHAKEEHIKHRIEHHKQELRQMEREGTSLSHELDDKKILIKNLPDILSKKLLNKNSLDEIRIVLESDDLD